MQAMAGMRWAIAVGVAWALVGAVGSMCALGTHSTAEGAVGSLCALGTRSTVCAVGSLCALGTRSKEGMIISLYDHEITWRTGASVASGFAVTVMWWLAVQRLGAVVEDLEICRSGSNRRLVSTLGWLGSTQVDPGSMSEPLRWISKSSPTAPSL